ncbi:hypothetical protein EC919_1271, partial [Pseudomonas graminis]|uniref:hypothetical protein n=1 Tax=Pseudomonas graminis TaxID=158627 RepID=UPI0010DBA568
TIQADGSFSCTVSLALGEHSFTATSGVVRSDRYIVHRLPIGPIYEDFETFPRRNLVPNETIINPYTGTSVRLKSGAASIGNLRDPDGPTTYQYLFFEYGTVEIKPPNRPKKVTFTRSSVHNGAKISYFDERHAAIGERLLDEGIMIINSDIPIYFLELSKICELGTYELIDNFTFE